MIQNYPNFDNFIINGLGAGFARSGMLFIPQANFIVDELGNLKINFLGKIESIHKDYGELKERFSLVKEIEKTNSSENRSMKYQSAYKKTRSIEIVAEIYAQDILLFGYSF